MARTLILGNVELNAALLQHLTALQIKGYSEFTIQNRKVHLGFFIRWCEDRDIRVVHEISAAVLDDYQRFIFEYRKRDGHLLSPASKFARMVPLRVWLRWMKQQNMIRVDPSSTLELPRLGRPLPHVVLSASDAIRILRKPNTRTAVGLRDRAILELLYSSGLRRLEIVRLQLTDLQLDRRLVLVRNGKGNRDRYVPVGDCAMRWLSRYLRRARPALAIHASKSALFLSREGRAMSRDHLTYLVSTYVRKASVGKWGACHLFRHSLATLMHENGADIRFVQQMLGHADIKTTQIYAQVAIRKLQEVHAATHPAW